MNDEYELQVIEFSDGLLNETHYFINNLLKEKKELNISHVINLILSGHVSSLISSLNALKDNKGVPIDIKNEIDKFCKSFLELILKIHPNKNCSLKFIGE